jgi:hypothetical protein
VYTAYAQVRTSMAVVSCRSPTGCAWFERIQLSDPQRTKKALVGHALYRVLVIWAVTVPPEQARRIVA